jgi:hypothetical protein
MSGNENYEMILARAARVEELELMYEEEKTARVAAEAEAAYLRDLLNNKIEQLEQCRAKYDELKALLAPLRQSVAAYKRHNNSNVESTAENNSIENEEAAELLCRQFIEQAHGAGNEANLLSAMLNHPLMKGLANEQLERRYEDCPKFSSGTCAGKGQRRWKGAQAASQWSTLIISHLATFRMSSIAGCRTHARSASTESIHSALLYAPTRTCRRLCLSVRRATVVLPKVRQY